MSQHQISTQELRTAIRLLERTYVGVGDQDEFFAVLTALRRALTTPVNTARTSAVVAFPQRVS